MNPRTAPRTVLTRDGRGDRIRTCDPLVPNDRSGNFTSRTGEHAGASRLRYCTAQRGRIAYGHPNRTGAGGDHCKITAEQPHTQCIQRATTASRARVVHSRRSRRETAGKPRDCLRAHRAGRAPGDPRGALASDPRRAPRRVAVPVTARASRAADARTLHFLMSTSNSRRAPGLAAKTAFI